MKCQIDAERKKFIMKLRITHYPQVPCKPYQVEVNSLEDAFVIYQTLGFYDLFLLANHHRCDYANATYVEVYDEDEKDWCDWYDYETGMDFVEWTHDNMKNKYFPHPFPETKD